MPNFGIYFKVNINLHFMELRENASHCLFIFKMFLLNNCIWHMRLSFLVSFSTVSCRICRVFVTSYFVFVITCLILKAITFMLI